MTVPPGSIAAQIAQRQQRVAEIRARGYELLQGGATGGQVTSWLSAEIDRVLVDLTRSATQAVLGETHTDLPGGCAVVAIGGTGRGELAPYSDVDLLFLSDKSSPEFSEIASAILRDCWDSGLKPGHTIQSVPEALSMAREDAHFATSLVSSRRLTGSESLVSAFRGSVRRRIVKRSHADFIRACVASREEERRQFGAAVKQLEPDVKRAPGGLRDVHLMMWIAYAVSEVCDLSGMRLRGLLPAQDASLLIDAWEFLTRVRLELHFHSGRAQDVFTREDQLRLAAARGIEPDPGQRPVERLMQMYFRHSSAIAEISDQFVRRHEPRTVSARVLSPLLSHRFDGIYVMRREGIDVAARQKSEVCAHPESVLKLFLASLLYDVDPVPDVIDRIREAVPSYPEQLSGQSGKMFRQILRNPGDMERVLRTMYASGVLEYVIPWFAHTRGLIQFNQYHSWTVDEHTLRAIRAAVAFRDDEGKIGSAYRAVRHKATLHLAILLHDIGKGFDRAHSEVGAEIAELVGPRLSMSPHKVEMLSFLVREHLTMAHLALRRDISDTQLVVDFARRIGSPERLRMLYVLTAADITAVGPGVFTDWKADLLGQLYSRAMEVLSGRPERHLEAQRIAAAHEAVRAQLSELSEEPVDEDWLERELDAMPLFYLTGESPNRVARDLLRLRSLPENGIAVWGNYVADTDVVEYRVITRGEAADGCFHRIAGALAALRMDILAASICTTRDGLVIDAFRVIDNDFTGEVPAERISEVAGRIRSVLARMASVEQLQSAGSRYVGVTGAEVSELEPRVVIDNDCARDFTVIDVFAYDRPALLYLLSKTLYELELSVHFARIGTHLDQIVDVFYVTDSKNHKIHSQSRTAEIRDRLLETIALADLAAERT